MDKNKAVHFLSLGLSPSQVASIVGVSPGRISQLLAEPEIKEMVALKEVENSEKNAEEQRIDAKMLSVKNTLLDNLAVRSNEASFMEIARAFEIVCRAESLKKNPIPLQGTQIFNGMTVQISMPQRTLREEIQITSDREVIAIGDRALAPLNASQVTSLFGRMKEALIGEYHEPESLPRSAA
jgi:hypothetical protein